MTSKPKNPFVFPQQEQHDFPGSAASEYLVTGGMALRDYFAGQAIAGIASNSGCNNWDAQKRAQCVYKLADAMLVEREKREK